MDTLPIDNPVVRKRRLLQKQRELETNIAAYAKQQDIRERIKELEATIVVVTQAVKELTTLYETEKNNPFNYYCYLTVESLGDSWRMRSMVLANPPDPRVVNYMVMADTAFSDQQLFKFTPSGEEGYYVLSTKAEGDKFRVQIQAYPIRVAYLSAEAINDWQKFQFRRLENGLYKIFVKTDTSNNHFHATRLGDVVLTNRTWFCLFLASSPDANKAKQFKLNKTDIPSNERVPTIVAQLQNKTDELHAQTNELAQLKASLIATPAEKAEWEQQLHTVLDQIAHIKIELVQDFTPYIEKKTQEKMLATDWNGIQVQIRNAIAQHSHNGLDSVQMTADAIADGAIEGRHINPDSDVTFNKLVVNDALNVAGNLSVNGKTQFNGALTVKGNSRDHNAIQRVTSNKQQVFSNDVYETLQGLEIAFTPAFDGYLLVQLKISGIQKDNVSESNITHFVLKQNEDIIDHSAVVFQTQGLTYMSLELSAVVAVVRCKTVTLRAQCRVSEKRSTVWVNRANSWSHLTVMELSSTRVDDSKPALCFACNGNY